MKLRLMAAVVWLAMAAAVGLCGDVKPRPAPKLPEKEWLNTAENKPLRLEELRGKVLLVEFWTYG